VTLAWYVSRQLLAALFMAWGGIAFIVLPAITVSAVHKLGGAVDLAAVLGYLPLVLANVAPYILPMGFLLAVVATFGRLAADNEWAAVQMARIHPLRLAAPGLVLAVALAWSTLWLVSSVAPHLRRQASDYRADAIVRAFHELSPGQTEIQIGEFYLDSVSRDGNTFRDVVVAIPEAGGGNLEIVADAISISFADEHLVARLLRPRVVQGEIEFEVLDPVFRRPLSELVKREQKSFTKASFRTNAAMREAIRLGEVDERRARDYQFEIHGRYALSSIYVLFLLLGAPTGVLLRRGSQLAALAAAVGYGLAYYLIQMRLGKELTYVGIADPIIGAWSADALFLAVGLVLMRKVFL
jgi:lipopolysaccharide export system permease protein